MMKSGYNSTIRKGEGELKPLTNTAIPETGEPRITKKRLVLVSLGLLIMGFMMGHLTNTQHSGLQMSQESITAQLVDSKEDQSNECERDHWLCANLNGCWNVCELYGRHADRHPDGCCHRSCWLCDRGGGVWDHWWCHQCREQHPECYEVCFGFA